MRYKGNRIVVMVVAAMLSLTAAAARHALIFGLGKQEDTRWARIHGDRDVAYVEQMLQGMGYSDITTLTNEQATKLGMVDAFMDLIARCRRGDDVYIHYSGHGQLMTDLDGDEALKWTNSHSEWDEAWIPYDAYMTYGPKDRGEKHFCDDEVAQFLMAVRQKIGRRGEITVVVDACHSGDATAATGDEAECVRGVDTKFSIPRDPEATQATELTAEQWRTISACKPYQLCTELKDKRVGKLTYALFTLGGKALRNSNDKLERQLADFMERHKGRLPQTPMVTGDTGLQKR